MFRELEGPRSLGKGEALSGGSFRKIALAWRWKMGWKDPRLEKVGHLKDYESKVNTVENKGI